MFNKGSGVTPTVNKWVPSETNYVRTRWGKVEPDEMARILGRSREAVLSRARKLGLYGMDFKARPASRMIRSAATREDMAARHLQRFAPCYRCTEVGTADPTGEFFRFGRAVLSGAEILEKAGLKGFAPNEWSRLL